MRWVFYVDMDAFYVNCELRDRPDLKGRPVIVGPDPKLGPTRGVVLSASYEARKFGVRSALPAAQAARMCPEAIWIPADFTKYERTSREVLSRLARFAEDARPFSIDEVALTLEAEGVVEADRLARAIQDDLVRTLHLPCTIGVAPSRLVAKIVTDIAKPAGVRVVGRDAVAQFLAPLPVRSIPGIGPKTEGRLREVGVDTVAQLLTVSRSSLTSVLGSSAEEYRRLARGEYVDPVERETGPKSRSTEETFESDLDQWPPVEEAIQRLAARLAEGLAQEHLRYQTVTVAVRWSDFQRIQRSHTLPSPREIPGDLAAAATRLLREVWSFEQGGRRRALRMLSVGVERLVPSQLRAVPLERFEAAEGQR